MIFLSISLCVAMSQLSLPFLHSFSILQPLFSLSLFSLTLSYSTFMFQNLYHSLSLLLFFLLSYFFLSLLSLFLCVMLLWLQEKTPPPTTPSLSSSANLSTSSSNLETQIKVGRPAGRMGINGATALDISIDRTEATMIKEEFR